MEGCLLSGHVHQAVELTYGRRAFLARTAGVALTALLVSACGGQGKPTQASKAGLKPYTTASVANSTAFPSYVTADLRDAYDFALARPDVLRFMPCYCGCGLQDGHDSNLDCFIAGVTPGGAVQFDNHGSGCLICVEVARDSKRLVAEGKSLREIRAYMDKTHGTKGPATNSPQPPA